MQDEIFQQTRPRLFGIAYRMLGSVMDAEDIVQEAYLRWSRADRATIESPEAWLAATVTRLCIDQLRSARSRHEQYVGPWLPEPLLTGNDPAMAIELAETLTTAFLILLEQLAPIERAVFLLHDVFEYSYDEIAAIVGKQPAACRQIAHRARGRVQLPQPRFAASATEAARLAERFASVSASGNVAELVALLDPDVVFVSDGGGKAPAARNMVHGASRVARLLVAITAKFSPATTSTMIAHINQRIGFVFYDRSHAIATVSLDVEDGRVTRIESVVNPDKLAHLHRSES
jgi:RNA polymerase sigma-70 factor, ECF subfamily